MFVVPILACAHDHHAISVDCIQMQGLHARKHTSTSVYFLWSSQRLIRWTTGDCDYDDVDDDGGGGGVSGSNGSDDDHDVQ